MPVYRHNNDIVTQCRKNRDPYDRDLSRSRGRGARGAAKGRSRSQRKNKSEEIALTRSGLCLVKVTAVYGKTQLLSVTTDLQCISLLPAGSDLAYETMYDDDEIMGTQTMPWFDPKYLAASNLEEVRLPLMVEYM